MKKFVLFLVCAVMMTVFIAFNYLLLDREKTTKNIENLKYNNDSQSAAIDVLGKDIKNSQDRITELNKTIQTLEKNMYDLNKQNTDLKLKEVEAQSTIDKKNKLIDKIKVEIGIEPFALLVKKWAESIDKGQFDVAYDLYPKDENGTDISLEEYTANLKSTIKNLKVKSMKIQTNEIKGVTEGKIIFSVSLEIKLMEKATQSPYTEGLNERLFTFDYDGQTDKWSIVEIKTI